MYKGCKHEDTYFDRTVCGEGNCRFMHTRCTTCHKPMEACAEPPPVDNFWLRVVPIHVRTSWRFWRSK